jgi:hypothetical protein
MSRIERIKVSNFLKGKNDISDVMKDSRDIELYAEGPTIETAISLAEYFVDKESTYRVMKKLHTIRVWDLSWSPLKREWKFQLFAFSSPKSKIKDKINYKNHINMPDMSPNPPNQPDKQTSNPSAHNPNNTTTIPANPGNPVTPKSEETDPKTAMSDHTPL